MHYVTGQCHYTFQQAKVGLKAMYFFLHRLYNLDLYFLSFFLLRDSNSFLENFSKQTPIHVYNISMDGWL